MSEPQARLRVRDLPVEQAGMLDRIHALAARATELQEVARERAGDTTAVTAVLQQLRLTDRDRAMTEIRARATGMPDSWIDDVRRLGRTGQPFTGDLRLPPSGRAPGPRSSGRALDDMHLMTEMAAVLVTREHLLAIYAATAEPDPVAAEQFRRNMQALWTRASRTADAIAMSARVRARTFHVRDTILHEQVNEFWNYSPDELAVVWDRHAAPSVASSVRRSLGNLRRAHPGRDFSTANPDVDQPPKPALLIERAREAVHLVQVRHYMHTILSEQPDTGRVIDTAIADATLADAVELDNPMPDSGPGQSATTAAPAHGPDP
ncbi:hypothetical protein ACIA8C_09905 [Nocardia sp. NPDC051321]|uniref:hypothetical protein n=1 Tax=Nocardia sp. NPDC051321 TaxID=3364323 RepID=UPI00379DE6F9